MKSKRAGSSRGRKGLRRTRNLFVFVFLIVFGIAVGFKARSLAAQGRQLEASMAEVRAQIELQKEYQLDAKTGLGYYSSEEYREQQARDRFNLIYPGDLIIEIK